MIEFEFNDTQWNKASSFYLRTLIFVQEQGISPKIEFDFYDSDDMDYLVIYHNKSPIATGRLIIQEEGILHPDRACVHKAWRNKGIGRRLVLELEFQGQVRGCHTAIVQSDKHAMGFYEKLGYVKMGEKFIQDGRIFVTMAKKLSTH